MKILIDVRDTYNNDAALRRFMQEFWHDLAASKPGHDFVFVADKKTLFRVPSNVELQELKKTGIGWLDTLRIKKAIAQQQAERWVTNQGAGFLLKNIQKNAAPTTVLFTGEASAALPGAIYLQPALRDAVIAQSWTESESIKTQYTGGRSFFLFTGDIAAKHQLISLLQAFSLFKKWQLSNMQLVIAGSATGWTSEFEEKLSSYKHKADVVVLKNCSNAEIAKLAAASYAMLYPVSGTVFPLGILLALQSKKAVIATDTDANRQLTRHAAWVIGNDTAEGFSKAMILLYKDEKQQQLLVQQSVEEAALFNRQQLLEETWHCIAK